MKSSWDAVGRIERLLDDQVRFYPTGKLQPFPVACHTVRQPCMAAASNHCFCFTSPLSLQAKTDVGPESPNLQPADLALTWTGKPTQAWHEPGGYDVPRMQSTKA